MKQLRLSKMLTEITRLKISYLFVVLKPLFVFCSKTPLTCVFFVFKDKTPSTATGDRGRHIDPTSISQI